MPEIQGLNGKGRFISHLSDGQHMEKSMEKVPISPIEMSHTIEASSQERANQLRAECEAALRTVLDIMDRAKNAGFTLGWNIATDPQGRHFLNGSVSVARYF